MALGWPLDLSSLTGSGAVDGSLMLWEQDSALAEAALGSLPSPGALAATKLNYLMCCLSALPFQEAKKKTLFFFMSWEMEHLNQ